MRLLPILAALVAVTRDAYHVHALSSNLAAIEAFSSPVSDVGMYMYTPQVVDTTDKLAIVVAIHSCERTAQYYFDNTGYAALADQYGYLVIYPNASRPSSCWDTDSTKSKTRNGGGDSQAIANMVSYAVENLNGDADRVAVTGSSSGAIMVQLLAGIYPDMFQSASVFSGMYANSIWQYSGSRPKMMIYHGTVDDKYPYFNFGIELDGWASVLDVTFSHNITNQPNGGYTSMVYGDGLKLVGVSAEGVGHTVPVDAAADMVWFCISPKCGADGLAAVSSTSTSSSSTSSSSSTASSADSSSTTSGEATTTGGSSTSASNTAVGETSSSTSAASVSQTAGAKSGLSTGAKAGVSIAGIIFGLLILGIIAGIFFCYRRRQARMAEAVAEDGMHPIDIDSHEMEYHSGYGAVPATDLKPAGITFEKPPAALEPTAGTGLLSDDPSEQRYRDHGYHDHDLPPPPPPLKGDDWRLSTSSSMLAPPSVREDANRFSSTSSTMLLPTSSRGDQQRFSTASATLLPQSREVDEEQDISEIKDNHH